MVEPKWRSEGDDPDYRFTLANERTFLAWIRTALALIAGGVLLHEFAAAIGPRVMVTILAVGLGLAAAALALLSYLRWRSNEIAMRHGRRLAFSWALPVLAAVCLVTAVVLTVFLALP
ncbi:MULTISPECIES: YidH family protein [unclassified Agromyces]|uniref:YidH family protein n=1 Tax=unclassified Agromyces TaxID=2639701 RepID=UPI00366F6350